MKYWIVFLYCISVVVPSLAQRDNIAEFWGKYREANTDTSKARLLDTLSYYYAYINIDSAFILNKEAMQLAQKHDAKELQSTIRRGLSAFFLQIGATMPALEIQFQLLEEARANNNFLMQQEICNVIAMNYLVNMNDLENGKKYSYLSMQIPGWERQKKYCVSTFLNLGDVYTKLLQYDSARYYLNKAFDLATNLYGSKENDYSSMIKNNFGNLYMKMNQPEMAVLYYRQSLPYAFATNYYDIICESGLGMAKMFEMQQVQDSVLYYANRSLAAATEAKYLSYMLASSKYLAEYYQKVNKLDSAVKYFSMSSSIRDSMLSNEKVNKIKVMEMQQIFREQEREQEEADAMEERRVNIQYAILLIGVISFLLLVLLLSRSFVVHHNLVRFLGVLSLLLVFEFFNLYLHPLLDKLTGHSPIVMLLIMTGIASLLIPLHQRLERWITNKLVEKNKKIRLAQAKKVIEELEG